MTNKEPEQTQPDPAEENVENPGQAAGGPEDVPSSEDPPPSTEAEGPEAQAIPDLMERLEAAEARAEEMQAKALRSLAELDNFRKRTARERQELIKSAAADVIESLLPALDNLRIGLQAAQNHPEAGEVAKGFEMVGKQIQNILQEQGLEELDPTGEPFDPHHHDSLTTQPSDEVEEGHVLQTIKIGYKLNEKLLRPASVVVSSGPAEPAADAENGEPS